MMYQRQVSALLSVFWNWILREMPPSSWLLGVCSFFIKIKTICPQQISWLKSCFEQSPLPLPIEGKMSKNVVDRKTTTLIAAPEGHHLSNCSTCASSSTWSLVSGPLTDQKTQNSCKTLNKFLCHFYLS